MTVEWKKKLGLTALALIMFIVTLDTTITNIALPTITQFFNSSLDISNWISTVYVLVLSALMIPASKIGDQIGRKKIVIVGLALFGVGSLLCSLSNSIIMLIGARALQGIGGAIATPILVPLCVSLFGREQANNAVGRVGAVAAFAAAIGPCIGGLIIEYWSWQGIFIINVPVTIITIVLINMCFKESYDHTISKKIDYLGIVLLSTFLFLLTFVLLKGYEYGWFSTKIVVMTVSSVIILVLFVSIDIRKRYPLIEFRLLKDITFTASMALYFSCGFMIVCSSVIFNFFLENVKEYSALHAGIIIMFSSLMVMIAMPLGNKLGQSLNFRWPIMTGSILMVLGSLLLTQLTYSTTLFNMIFAMCVLGLGFGFSSLSLISAVQYIPEEKAGIASGMVNAARQIGTCLGIALLVGVLNNNLSSAVSTVKDNTLSEISRANLSSHVKEVSSRQISKVFIYDGSGKSTKKIDKDSIIAAAKQVNKLPQPKKGTSLYKLYINEKKMEEGLSKLTIGMHDLHEGLGKSVNGGQKISDGMDSLSHYLDTFTQQTPENIGASPISIKFQNLTDGSKQLTDNLLKVYQGSQDVTDGYTSLQTKQNDIIDGIALIAQKKELNDILENTKDNKNKELTNAFNKTFVVSTIFLLIFVPISYLTDRYKTKS